MGRDNFGFMKIGTYYYPEQWPREQWERDFDNIASMGLQIVHMGEFAWFSLEPRAGEFHFDWLSDCVEMAAKRKLDVILCTPTAAPPIWLSHEYPETLPMSETGVRMRFGGRRHYTPTSPAMREATARIVTALAERFGQHPSVIGWQIDNEYSGPYDQSPATHEAFRQWLRRRYGSIEALNAAWGNPFWNTYYTDFAQILMPVSRELSYVNPHHLLDAARFWSWAYADFNKLQADILKKHIGGRFITTNFMPFHLDCNPEDMAKDLTLFAWDSYPVTGWVRNPPDETYRLADPDAIGMVHDQMASYTGRWALMELQPGQINWSGVPVLVYPGAVRLWIWTAFAHGAEFVTTYRYRQPRFGCEMWHHGLVTHDGVTPSPGGRQFVQVIDEMKHLDLSRVPPIAEDEDLSRTAGLVFDFEQLWWFKTLPQARRWDPVRFMQHWYGAAMRLGLKVKILRPGTPWPKDLPIVIVPAVQMVDDAMIQQMDAYAAGGGHLLLTCRTATHDRNGHFFEGPTAAPILPLIGATIEAYDVLPDGHTGEIEMDGQKYAWGAWGELLYVEDKTKIVAKYADQFYADAAAATRRKHGRGTVSYCGVAGEGAFCDAFLEKLATEAKLEVSPLPSRVHIIRRGPYRVLLNYQDKPVEAPAPKGTRFLVGGRKVDPAGVAVWEEA
jgi:beta-galactosidase